MSRRDDRQAFEQPATHVQHTDFKGVNLKQFFSTTTGYLIKHLALFVLAVVTLIVLANLFMNLYTHHGESEVVSDFKGMTEDEFAPILHEQNLDYEIVDSIFDRKQKGGIVIEQSPPAGSTIKHSRPVYFIINAYAIRKFPVPDIKDMSYRQAEATLKAVGFVVDRVEYKPSEYKDLVLDAKAGGRTIQTGERLDEGTSITLVLGNGGGSGTFEVPNLRGRTLQEAQRVLAKSPFVLGGVDYDETSDTAATYYIYWQNPPAGALGAEGMRVNVKISTDKDHTFFEETITDKTVEEEEFF